MLWPSLLALVFIAVCLPAIWAPLHRCAGTPVTASTGDGAPSNYASVLLSLRDLAFDHELGVVNDDDYARLHERLVAEAASAHESSHNEKQDGVAAAIEDAIRVRREQQRQGPAVAHPCPQCGCPVETGDRYCFRCGASLLLEPR